MNFHEYYGWSTVVQFSQRNKKIDVFSLSTLGIYISQDCFHFQACFFQGKLEMEIELCDEDEHAEKACAKARDEPNANPVLEPPKYSSRFL